VAILVVKGEGLPARGAWPGIIVSGVLWFGVYMVALNWGEQHLDAGTAAMVVNIGPVLIAVLGGWLLREGFPARLMAGLVVSFAGAIIVGFSTSDGGATALLGVVLCLVAAIVWAAATIAQKPALTHASALQVTTFGSVIGTIACLPFAGQLVTQVAAAPSSSTLSLMYLGVFPTALAFTTWAYVLARTTAGKTGVTTYAVPALVVLMSWLALDEVPGALTIVGGVLCLAGVAITRSRPCITQPPADLDPEQAGAASR
jgi:drug/metabolite transporter (DMT)-like permease